MLMKRRPPAKLLSLNAQAIEGLADVAGIEYLQELLKVYVDDAVGRLAMLSAAIEQGDAAMITADDQQQGDIPDDDAQTIDRLHEQLLDLTCEQDVQEVGELLARIIHKRCGVRGVV